MLKLIGRLGCGLLAGILIIALPCLVAYLVATI